MNLTIFAPDLQTTNEILDSQEVDAKVAPSFWLLNVLAMFIHAIASSEHWGVHHALHRIVSLRLEQSLFGFVSEMIQGAKLEQPMDVKTPATFLQSMIRQSIFSTI